MKKVLAFGTFDHFHAGHEAYLKQAKALGDFLVVIIARDTTVQSIKGKKSDQTEKERRTNVLDSGLADKAVLGEHGDKYEVIRRHKPDVIALGYDQFAFTFRLKKFLIDNKFDTRIVRLEAYHPAVYKTSLLRKQKNPAYATSLQSI